MNSITAKDGMKAANVFATLLVVLALLLSQAGSVFAQQEPPPELPSSFYGIILINDGAPAVGDTVTVWRDGVQAASTTVRLHNGTQKVYSLNVPGVSGDQGKTLTFKIGERIVATSIWEKGTNKGVDFHPPAPSVSGSGAEGSEITLTYSAVDSKTGGDTVTYSFDCAGGTNYVASDKCTFADNGSYPVSVKAVDSQGGEGYASGTVTVSNIAPVVTVSSGSPINEGGVFSISGSFTDPGADTWTARVDYGDGAGEQDLALTDKTFTLNHAYKQDGAYTVTVKVTDDDSGEGTGTSALTVNNVLPVVSAGGDSTINEGSTFTRAGSFTDPGEDAWTAKVNYGDGSGDQALALSDKAFNLSHIYAAEDVYTVTVTVDDGKGSGTASFKVTVSNVLPILTVGENVTLDQGGTLNRKVTFTDPGPDAWTATVNYGDGSAVANPTITDKSFDLNHAYIKVGTHTVAISVNDGAGSGTGSFTVTVSNVAPQATFNVPTASVPEGSGFELSITGLIDPGSATETYTYAFDCGSGYGAFGTAATAACATSDDGFLNVRGKVKDSSGGETEYTGTVAVTDVQPADVSAGGPYTTVSGTPVTLEGSYSCVPADECVASWDLDHDGTYGEEPDETDNPVTITPYKVGNDKVYFRVKDNDGNIVYRSGTLTVTGVIQSISLKPGWNLVSFYLDPANKAVQYVLSTISGKYDLVYAWNAGDQAWALYDASAPYGNELTSLDNKTGFWVHITGTDDVTLTVIGGTPTSTQIPLKTGWNLVGYPSITGRAMPGALDGTGFTLAYAYRANDAADPWKLWDVAAAPFSNDLTTLTPGWGYWVYVKADAAWTVTNP